MEVRSVAPRFELRYVVGGMACIRLVAAFEQRLTHRGGSRVRSLLLAPDSAWRAGAPPPARAVRYEREEQAEGGTTWHARVRHARGRRATVHEAHVEESVALALARGDAVAPDGAGAVAEAWSLARWEGHVLRCALARERQSFHDRDSDLEVLVDSRLRCSAPRPMATCEEGVPVLAPGEHLLEVRVRGAVPYWLAVLLRRLDGVRRAPSDLELAHAALTAERPADISRSAG